MIEDIKILLGNSVSNFTDAQIGLAYKYALSFVEEYCQRNIDYSLSIIAEKIAVIYLNRLGTEGLASESFSSVSNTFIDGLPADILSILNRKRKIKLL